MLYGTFLKRLWYIKEAFFSWDQFFTEMSKNFDHFLAMQQQQSLDPTQSKSTVSKNYHDVPVSLIACNQKDPRNFRPLSVKLSLAIHNINGHLALDLTDGVGANPLPIGFTDRLALELDKTYAETKLQLYVNPVNIFLEDRMPRQYDKNLYQGHLCLSSVQLRGHAMFSDEQRVKTDTLEYAWLLEILLGDVTGAVTPIQAEQLVHGLEAFLTTLLENDFQLQPVFIDRIDPGLPYKYEVTRFSLDKVDLYLIESGTALNINLDPVRLSLCNSHTEEYAKCLSAIVGDLKLKFFVNEASRVDIESSTRTSTTLFSQKNQRHRKSATAFTSRSNTSLNQSISSLSSLNSSIRSQNTLIENNNKKKNTNLLRGDSSSTLIVNENYSNSRQKCFDSNDFNYWFEASSLSIGVIKFDLTLDSGNPVEQLKFLRLHDAKTKRLYFLWQQGEFDKRHQCGCYGDGCWYYSVFPTKENFEFFNLEKSISRKNKLYGDSLFFPGVHILESQPLMRNKYPMEHYIYDKSPFDDHLINEEFILNNNKSGRINSKKISSQLHHSLNAARPSFHRSISSISERFYKINEDNYFTASEEDDDDDDIDTLSDDDYSIDKDFDDSVSRQSNHKSFKSMNSKQSYFSTSNQQTNNNKNDDRTLTRNQQPNFNDVEAEAKMDLNFDIRRPILDSSLPKYCYLKHLSRAYVENWNKKCSYPYYEDFSGKNIRFVQRQKGISFSYDMNSNNDLNSNFDDSSCNSSSCNFSYKKSTSDDQSSSADSTDEIVKCRVNLKFSTLDCYITPLLLTGLSRFTNSLKYYKINPNSLITELEAKAHAHCAANSIIEAISKTQVSIKIPQIRLFSLQCGLAEGDKISNAFTNTLENPDQFITPTLFTIFINSIQTQLIDSPNRTSALFMINQIVTQFSRLYDEAKVQNNAQNKLKLSCIYSDDDSLLKNNLLLLPNLKSLLMYECAFDSISIKALKNGASVNAQNVSNRMSLCDFDITKIWFSFPEPPQSPKGKRKIPFTRFDWNLLSSVSPAVISWLCAVKNTLKPIKELIEWRSKRYLQIVAALVAGALNNREQLEREMNALQDFYNNRDIITKSKHNESRFSRHNNKSNLMMKKANPSDTIANFMKIYLNKSAYEMYKDPTCKLVNIMRNYLLYFSDDFNSDMNSNLIPESGQIKKGISEVLNTWSNNIITDEDRITNDEFKFFTEIREDRMFEYDQSSDEFQMMNLANENNHTNNSNNNTQDDGISKDGPSQESDIIVSIDDKNVVTSQIIRKESKSSLNKTDMVIFFKEFSFLF
jgi:hypothetical protein